MADKKINQFLLPNTRQSMIGSLRQILDFINRYLPAHAVADDVNFKIDIIVTELLTNALKHVKNAETSVSVTIDEDHILLEKTDFGTPFNPNNFVEVLKKPVAHKSLLAKDDLHSVYAVVEKENTVKFVCEEHNAGTEQLNDIMEHFGLLIITKCAHEFTYRFDDVSGLNTFIVCLKLR